MKNHQRLSEIPSAWHGLEFIADWIVETTRPHVTVDLGVDHGFSTLVLAQPGFGTVYGIDTNAHTMDYARRMALELGIVNANFINSKFDEVATTWTRPVDILHIDGNHDYASVRNDFDTWVPMLRPGGILLMHDIDAFKDGPGRVFNETDWPKWCIHNYNGLGVLTKPYAR